MPETMHLEIEGARHQFPLGAMSTELAPVDHRLFVSCMWQLNGAAAIRHINVDGSQTLHCNSQRGRFLTGEFRLLPDGSIGKIIVNTTRPLRVELQRPQPGLGNVALQLKLAGRPDLAGQSLRVRYAPQMTPLPAHTHHMVKRILRAVEEQGAQPLPEADGRIRVHGEFNIDGSNISVELQINPDASLTRVYVENLDTGEDINVSYMNIGFPGEEAFADLVPAERQLLAAAVEDVVSGRANLIQQRGTQGGSMLKYELPAQANEPARYFMVGVNFNGGVAGLRVARAGDYGAFQALAAWG